MPQNSATTTTMKTCPQGSYRKERENDEPITGLTDFDRLITTTTDFWTALDNGAKQQVYLWKSMYVK